MTDASPIPHFPRSPKAIGWSPERTHTGGCHEHAVWRDCPTCWAQGRIWQPYRWAHGALTLTPTACPTCLGVGQVLTHQERP